MLLDLAQFRSQRAGCGIGRGAELLLQQGNDGLIIFERLGVAAGRGQRAHDQAVRILAHAVECIGALAGEQGIAGTSVGQFLVAERYHRADSQLR